jgi:hypothetical protein
MISRDRAYDSRIDLRSIEFANFRKQLLLCSWLLTCLTVGLLMCAGALAMGQGTAFAYQGRLADNNLAANGNYDFEFKLYDTAAVGTGVQQGPAVQRLNVNVVNGLFTVSLDFGACASCFTGADRFLEVSVKQTSGSTFTTLGPRQPTSSTPYALKSLNAASADGISVTCVNCITSAQIQSVQGSQVTGNIAGGQISGEIPVGSLPTGSSSYIQNTTSQQSTSDFNISGNGTAGGTLSATAVNAIGAAAQYQLNNNRVLSNAGSSNLFAGVGAGSANTGVGNAFFGYTAGNANSTGNFNSFFGTDAGFKNTTGGGNAFFGAHAGHDNTTGDDNGFFGVDAGLFNTMGGHNAFFGSEAGINNTVGDNNSFFGSGAGSNNTDGNSNTFLGRFAGNAFSAGDNNTIVGSFANLGFNNLTNATAIGFRARVDQSDSLVLGSINGINFSNADTHVGIGTSSPSATLDVHHDSHTVEDTVRFTSYGINNKVIGRATSGIRTVPNATNAGVDLLQLGGTGYDGSDFVDTPRASISFQTTERWSQTANGTKILFKTTGTGTSATFTRMTINDDGNVGIGTTTPVAALHIVTIGSGATPNANASMIVDSSAGHFVNVLGGDSVQTGVLFGKPTGGGSIAGIVFNNSGVPDGLQFRTGGSASTRLAITSAGDVGIGTGAPSDKLHVNGIIRISTLGAAGSIILCRNSSDQIATCSSSLRYKTNIQPFTGGLDVVNRLRPISFTWKQSGIRDIGFGAEDVARVAPLFTFTNDRGEIEGVKYDRIGVVLVNAIKEQQEQIGQQQSQIGQQQSQIKTQETLIRRQQIQIDALKKIVCLDHPNADICR